MQGQMHVHVPAMSISITVLGDIFRGSLPWLPQGLPISVTVRVRPEVIWWQNPALEVQGVPQSVEGL
ncbi:Hypothetical protein SCLAV_2427 [Streptomyces clavuligerus]|uniref:Uncharacterized protein n=1 Tax=Streptomyces clavuligerus TaxID=1901 RepID=E2Q8L2_STRCL|nr:Hypothetical protein SCLAV_2427 [Streptomyces clavuligerus]